MAALILIDIQNDFLPGGALPVPDGEMVVPIANALMDRYSLIIATQDWHPRNHGSFASNHRGKKPGDVIELAGLQQILWPEHCVQHTFGAEFAPGLHSHRIEQIFQKGSDPTIDSYSGLYDNGHRKSTGLAEFLRSQNIKEIALVGLATDYCVKFTALDAKADGFDVTLVEDGCRGVNLSPTDSAAAIDEMRQAGVQIMRSAQILRVPKT